MLNANNACLAELQLEALNLPPTNSLLDIPSNNEADDNEDDDDDNNDDDDVVVVGPRFQARVELAVAVGNCFTLHFYRIF